MKKKVSRFFLVLMFLSMLTITGIFYINQSKHIFVNTSNSNLKTSESYITVGNNIVTQNKNIVSMVFENVTNNGNEVEKVEVVVYPIEIGKYVSRKYTTNKNIKNFKIEIDLKDFDYFVGEYVTEIYVNNKLIDKLFFNVIDNITSKDFYIKYNNVDEYFNIVLEELKFDLKSNVKSVNFKVWTDDISQYKVYKGKNLFRNNWGAVVYFQDFNWSKDAYNIRCEIIDTKGKKYQLDQMINKTITKK